MLFLLFWAGLFIRYIIAFNCLCVDGDGKCKTVGVNRNVFVYVPIRRSQIIVYAFTGSTKVTF